MESGGTIGHGTRIFRSSEDAETGAASMGSYHAAHRESRLPLLLNLKTFLGHTPLYVFPPISTSPFILVRGYFLLSSFSLNRLPELSR